MTIPIYQPLKSATPAGTGEAAGDVWNHQPDCNTNINPILYEFYANKLERLAHENRQAALLLNWRASRQEEIARTIRKQAGRSEGDHER